MTLNIPPDVVAYVLILVVLAALLVAAISLRGDDE